MSLRNFAFVLALWLLSVLNLFDQTVALDSDVGVCPYPCNQPPPPPSGYPLYGAPPAPPAPPSTSSYPLYRPPPSPPQLKCPPFPVECCRQPPPSPLYPYVFPPPYPYGTVPVGGGAAASYSTVVLVSVMMLVFSSAAIVF